MCQVLDGEPPIQIKWLKDDLELASGESPQAALASSFVSQAGPAAAPPLGSIDGGAGGRGAAGAANGQTAGSPLGPDVEMMSNDELGSSLLFRKVGQQHGGNYTCLASNHLGSASYSSFMTVKGE